MTSTRSQIASQPNQNPNNQPASSINDLELHFKTINDNHNIQATKIDDLSSKINLLTELISAQHKLPSSPITPLGVSTSQSPEISSPLLS